MHCNQSRRSKSIKMHEYTALSCRLWPQKKFKLLLHKPSWYILSISSSHQSFSKSCDLPQSTNMRQWGGGYFNFSKITDSSNNKTTTKKRVMKDRCNYAQPSFQPRKNLFSYGFPKPSSYSERKQLRERSRGKDGQQVWEADSKLQTQNIRCDTRSCIIT